MVERRPRLIIAFDCELDLASSIQDNYPLLVFGITNERPHGPCYHTQVNLDRVEEALKTFLIPSPLPLALADSPGEEA